MEDCVFCKIVKGELPSEKIKETDNLLVFKSKFPDAPTHLLIVPKKHVTSIIEVSDTIWLEMKHIAVNLGKQYGFKGYRLVNNVGEAALIQHLHLHFMGEIDKNRKV